MDGVSLLNLFDGHMKTRPRPLGFWKYPSAGSGTPSDKLLEELAQEQAQGTVAPASERTTFRHGVRNPEYSGIELPGHSAWIDGNFKLHRIADEKGNIEYALFDLANDPVEQHDLIADEKGRAAEMKEELETWQRSVLESIDGKDYPEHKE